MSHRGRGRGNNEFNRRGGSRTASSRGRSRQADDLPKSPKPPVILAKPNAEKAKEPSIKSDNEPRNEKRQLLSRKESSKAEDSRSTDSPKSSSSIDNVTSSTRVKDSDSYVPVRNLKLIDDHLFCEPLYDYMSENNDFIVIGVIGCQSVGKSQLLNALINQQKSKSEEKSRMFRVQTFEKQMLSEHCTNGVNSWVGENRIIYLDSQPLFSNSVLDRSAQLEKKYSFEFSGAENTNCVHSLQIISYFMSICHLVLVVQEGSQCDSELMDKIKMSELLKPAVMASASFEDPDTLVEYAPEVTFVHNKLETSEMNTETYQRLRNDYNSTFQDNSVGFRYKNSKNEVNLLLLPDLEANENRVPMDDNYSFDSAIISLRQSLSRLQMRPFTSNVKQSEKNWFQHCQKTWEQIKTSNFYLEYSRLLKQKSPS